MLWMDHCTLGYRAGLVHDVLWELSLVYGKVLLKPTRSNKQSIRLEYERRDHMPGDTEVVDVIAARSLGLQQRSTANRPPKKPKRERSPKKRARLELSLLRVLEMIPKTVDDVVPLSRFQPKGKTAVRQFGEVDRSTQLYRVDGESVVAGRKLPELLEALERQDIVRVNKLFCAVSTYDEMLRLAAKDPRLPNQRTGGAATGWAVCLGAAFKQKNGAFYGLQSITVKKFARVVMDAHSVIGEGQAAVQLPPVLEKVCEEQGISPLRFEVMLGEALAIGGGLDGYEAQRSGVPGDLPSHTVITSPATSGSYTRTFDPARGIVVGDILVNSLVRRTRSGS